MRPAPTVAWWWGLVLSIVVFGLLTGLGVVTESYGFALMCGAPFLCGFILGRWVEAPKVLRVFLAIVALVAFVLSAITAEIAGMLCGLVFAVVVSVPLLLGVLAGSFVFRGARATTSAASVAMLALLIPLEQTAVPRAPVESVSTSRVATMAAGEVFSRITFYEDTTEAPPTLLRISLPRPIGTWGEAGDLRNLKRCIYESGHLLKEVTVLEPGARYEFRVIEQVGVEDRSVDLVGGSFELFPLEAGRTRVVLTTHYRPKLSARALWRPFERAVVHALHEHVLHSMLAPDLTTATP